jgi:hypothetical protein
VCASRVEGRRVVGDLEQQPEGRSDRDRGEDQGFAGKAEEHQGVAGEDRGRERDHADREVELA